MAKILLQTWYLWHKDLIDILVESWALESLKLFNIDERKSDTCSICVVTTANNR